MSNTITLDNILKAKEMLENVEPWFGEFDEIDFGKRAWEIFEKSLSPYTVIRDEKANTIPTFYGIKIGSSGLAPDKLAFVKFRGEIKSIMKVLD